MKLFYVWALMRASFVLIVILIYARKALFRKRQKSAKEIIDSFARTPFKPERFASCFVVIPEISRSDVSMHNKIGKLQIKGFTAACPYVLKFFNFGSGESCRLRQRADAVGQAGHNDAGDGDTGSNGRKSALKLHIQHGSDERAGPRPRSG